MKPKILYFHTGKPSFVLNDINILEENYRVVDFFFDTRAKGKFIFQLMWQTGFILGNFFGAKLFICQFGGHHTFIPVLFSRILFKKSVIIAGGTDCVSLPSIAYGNFNNKLLAFTTRFSFKNCNLILPVHDTLIEYDYTYQPADFPKQGMKYFIKDLRTKTEVIYNGYDPEKWFCNSPKQKNTFITISGGLHTVNGFVLKGVDMIFEIAPLFPETEFYIVGGASVKIPAPANVKLLQNIPNDEIQPLLSRMQFYVQLSLSEGFPNAVSESMLCECVPIVSAVGGMPDLVGDCGYILKHKSVPELCGMIKAALDNKDLASLGKKARKRVEERFSLESRRKKLIFELEKLI